MELSGLAEIAETADGIILVSLKSLKPRNNKYGLAEIAETADGIILVSLRPLKPQMK